MNFKFLSFYNFKLSTSPTGKIFFKNDLCKFKAFVATTQAFYVKQLTTNGEGYESGGSTRRPRQGSNRIKTPQHLSTLMVQSTVNTLKPCSGSP
jgi:hypothetical protein